MSYAIAIAIVAAFGVMLYRGARLWAFTAATALALVALAGLGYLGVTGSLVAAALFLPAAAVLNLQGLRAGVLTRPLFRAFQRVLPEMSPTEKEALEAGDTWWEAELFQGRPDWRRLRSFRFTQLTDEEQRFLDNETETLCRLIDEWQVHFEDKDLSPEVWDYIRRKGFFAMLINKDNGGLGFSPMAQSYVVSKIATRSITAAVTVMVPNSLGPGELIQHYGTEAQKRHWLPRLASGEEIPCFGLTGPEVGSDASSIPDVGVVCRREVDGEAVTGIRITLNKRYITLAPVATVIGLAFQLKDPDGLLGGASEDYGITCALVPRDTPGLEIGRRHYPGGAFMNGPIRGEDVFVPLDAIIGGPEQAGKGWRMLVECLSAGRGISLPALSAASGLGMYGATGAYAAIRRQFNVPVGRFEGVQAPLARIGGMAYTLEAARAMTASALDHCAPSVVTAIMKYHATEMMRQILVDAMDIHGGRGIVMGPRNYLAVPWQQLPVAITVEGANIMTRSLIIFGQGAIRCHPYVYKEMDAVARDDLADFDRQLFGHLGYALNRGMRATVLAWTGGRLGRRPSKGPMAGYYPQIERLSAALAVCADVALGTLGGALKFREATSARLGDMLSQLYLASAVLQFYEQRGSHSADHLVHARWAMDNALAQAGEALDAFCRNYPVPGVGRFLRFVLLPFGRPWQRPSDRATTALAELMLTANDVARDIRERGLVYVGDADEPTGRLLKAFDMLQAVQAPYERFLKAVSKGQIDGEDLATQLQNARAQGLITAEEADAIHAYDEIRYDVILTDDFDPDYVRDPVAYKHSRLVRDGKTRQKASKARSAEAAS